ncbi:MAG: hypothetical protein RIC16_02080 [Rhodospirillales bacterium]
MTNDLIQYLIMEAGCLLENAPSGRVAADRVAEAEELTLLAGRLLDRREAAVAAFEYREAA